MNQVGKVIANILLFALAIGLTIFTATRTLDLLAQWLPVNQSIMQYLGLAAFEGGTYFWSFYFVKGAKGAIQRGIAIMMVIICFIAVAVATVMDMLLVGSESGKLPAIPTDQKMTLVVFVSVVIVLNVGAFLSVKLTDPDKLRAFAIQDAEDDIYAAELKSIRFAAPHLAAQMAPIKTQQWVDQTWSALLPGTAQSTRMIDSTAQYAPQQQQQYTQPLQQMSMAQTATPSAIPQQPQERGEGVLSKLQGLFNKSKDTQDVEEEVPVTVVTPVTPQKGGEARQPRPFHADPYGADKAQRNSSNKFASNRKNRRRGGKGARR